MSLSSAGWTVVTPSADSRMVYVSSSAGSDTKNNGLSQAAPVATLAKAYSLLRSGYPDWILLNRGDTFTGGFAFFSDSGRSAQEPMVVTYYGDPTLARPTVDAGSAIAFRTGSSNHDLDVIGINFTSSTHNPTSPSFNGQGNYGFYDLGGTTDLLLEDDSFSYFINDITFQGYYAPLYNITIRRSEILDAFNTAGHSQGLYADTVTGLTLDQNVFDHDGWNANVPGAQATIYNHDCYLHSSNINVVVTANTFADAASFGLQARSGGIVDNNLFVNDPYAFSFGLVNGATTTAGGVSGQVIGNVIDGSRPDPSGWGVGSMIGNLAVGGGTTIAQNIFTDDTGGTQAALAFQPGIGVVNPTQAVGLNTLIVSNNVVYDWGFGMTMASQYVAGTAGQNGLTAVVIRNNDFQNDAVTGRIISHGNVYDPRFEDWSGNVYSTSPTAQSQWFNMLGSSMSLTQWQANIEPTAVAAAVPFLAPNRTVAAYMGSQGMSATLAAFIAGARAQSQTNWNPLYFATTVNSYIQGGFLVDSTPPVAVAVPPADVTPASLPGHSVSHLHGDVHRQRFD